MGDFSVPYNVYLAPAAGGKLVKLNAVPITGGFVRIRGLKMSEKYQLRWVPLDAKGAEQEPEPDRIWEAQRADDTKS